MKHLKYLIPFALVMFILNSCDKVTPPDGSLFYINDTVSASLNDTQNIAEKKVLIIDFTGIRCTNCPGAHEVLHQLENIYPDKIIPIAIHGTLLAYPTGEYITDLRTIQGNEIIDEFGINAIPIGLVDYFDKTYLSSEATWSDEVTTNLQEAPLFGIEIENTFNNTDNSLEVLVDLTSLSNFEQSLSLIVYLVEDSIITRQATNVSPGYIEEYEQMNVFRTAVSNLWGDTVFSEGSSENQTDTKTFNITLDNTWNANNCKIVAFICDNSNKVLNANSAKIK
ncbi:MAG: Omp28 family outer membrane lipoprotein [Bacteroidales bacterium]|nr:Omp28 family outer membrane lipoprotein [Bacteroidales bacterium]